VLSAAPRVLHEEGALDVSVLQISAEDRQRLEEQRAARIAAQSKPDIPLDPRCIVSPRVCVFMVAITPVVMVGSATVRHVRASSREPSLIPVRDSALLARTFASAATGDALAQRVAWKLGTSSDDAPLLVIGMTDVGVQSHSRKRVSLRLKARAVTYSPEGVAVASSQHTVLVPARSIGSWTADEQAIRRDIDQALDVLASGIAFAYLPSEGQPTARRCGGTHAPRTPAKSMLRGAIPPS
jgi:hypothetical protein